MKLKLKQPRRANGFGMAELLVTCAMMGIILPVVHQIALVPVVAQIKSTNFQRAESKGTMFAASAVRYSELPLTTPDNCSVTEDDPALTVYTITCTEGSANSVKATFAKTFQLQELGNPGLYTDTNEDGFEDKTGLPTHYDQCYAGWKGNGFKHSNCVLGGQYVIPMYSQIYSP